MEVSAVIKSLQPVLTIDISADDLVTALLEISRREVVCILDSCGVGHLGSHLLIAGIGPTSVEEMSHRDPELILTRLDRKLCGEEAAIFTLSYDLGRKIQTIESKHRYHEEPDVFIARFATLIVHDYDNGSTFAVGSADIEANLLAALDRVWPVEGGSQGASISLGWSSHTRSDYIASVVQIQERIRSGDTYQTNLTQQFVFDSKTSFSGRRVFQALRRDHPAPFGAYISRPDSVVISASPERFFRLGDGVISTSPIKGTRPRSEDPATDFALRRELVTSEKDRAENTMIVDLLRNDLGRVCEYGSVRVEKLCDIEEHPTLYHLVSTVTGELRNEVKFSEILRALFPCGSITGAPKISTMRIIDEIEPCPRGLSMGAIGYYAPEAFRKAIPGLADFDLSVAIRTMVIRDGVAKFNVGGGIVIDSDPGLEYEESLLKAQALIRAMGFGSLAAGLTFGTKS